MSDAQLTLDLTSSNPLPGKHPSPGQVLASPALMLAMLDQWAQAGWLRWLDVEVARFLWNQTTNDAPVSAPLLLAAALCSHQNGHGHACLDLAYCLQDPDRALALPPDKPHQQPDVLPQRVLAALDLHNWRQQLPHASVCQSTGKPYQSDSSPLVLLDDDTRPLLYLRRFWNYEQRIQAHIEKRLQQDSTVDIRRLRVVLDRLFNESSRSGQPTVDWQKIACANAARAHFAIITGGPGTGKTTTVIRLLAALHDVSDTGAPLRIRLAAPTGKAAVRLSESIGSQRARLQGLAEMGALPDEVTTLHRLLGPVPNSRQFRHHAANPLPADVVVVDEASMIDIELFAHLLDALPEHCRLILLGDKDQLASVEAGAVLGSLCARAEAAHYNAQTLDWLKQTTGYTLDNLFQDDAGRPLDQAISMLRVSHRFADDKGIGALAKAINLQRDTVHDLFDGRHSELHHIILSTTADAAFTMLVLDKNTGYGPLLTAIMQQPDDDILDQSVWDSWALNVLSAFDRFRVLAAVRGSEFGTLALNQRVESILRRAGLDTNDDTGSEPVQYREWYRGRAVMLTRNDYNLKLMNGDIGVVLPHPGSDGQLKLRVAFPGSDPGSVRWVSPARLQSVETAFVMTVHKSQGSEFAHTALVLPAHDVPILTRELIYTAVTRASQRFTLLTPHTDMLTRAISRRVLRQDGLNRGS